MSIPYDLIEKALKQDRRSSEPMILIRVKKRTMAKKPKEGPEINMDKVKAAVAKFKK